MHGLFTRRMGNEYKHDAQASVLEYKHDAQASESLATQLTRLRVVLVFRAKWRCPTETDALPYSVSRSAETLAPLLMSRARLSGAIARTIHSRIAWPCGVCWG